MSAETETKVDEAIMEVLRDCYDPEIPINIVDLGLIRGLDMQDDTKADIKMTLTAVACTAAEELQMQVKEAAESVPEVTDAMVELVWDPPWEPSMATEEGQWQLKAMGVTW